jgi:hypothetical protein
MQTHMVAQSSVDAARPHRPRLAIFPRRESSIDIPALVHDLDRERRIGGSRSAATRTGY